MGSLNCLGMLWAFLSFIGMGLCSVGFYMPYWLHGSMIHDTPVFLGTFRRCNYPSLSVDGNVAVVRECGRYSTFWDIPSLWWQIGTVVIGVGCCLGVVVAFTAMFACCIADVFSKTSSRIVGALQFISGLLISGGMAIYPLGWDSPEVKQVCGGKSAIFSLGTCTLSWAFYITAAGAGTCLLCSLLSCHVVRRERPKYVPTRYRAQLPPPH